MKTFLITLLFTLNLQAKMATDTFTDKVKLIKDTKDGIKIAFEVQSAFYHLKNANPHFLKLKKELDEAQKSHKKLKVTAVVPAMEIQEISAE